MAERGREAGRYSGAVIALWAGAVLADPVLSIAGTMDASRDYGVVLQALADVGADATSLTVFWDQSDLDGTYAADPDWPAIANAVYPDAGLDLTLMISVIDTVADRRPADLRGLDWSDPRVIARFDAFLAQVLARMPDTTLLSIGIGNEVDGYLTGAGWEDFGTFFTAARASARRLRPGVPVGMTLTWDALASMPQARALADRGDVWMVNHYPLDAGFALETPEKVAADLAAMLAATGRPVWLTETGYPSGGCSATPQGQADFTAQVLDFAADHVDRMGLVTLVWLHDLSAEEVAGYGEYYGVADGCFASYLATLGLRTQDGTDKPAFALLRERAR